jgi:hypothetical protein
VKIIKIGFALGGLAGHNAHGAGFLQAAIDAGVQPYMISCTSGQILWVSRYLKALKGDKGKHDVLLSQLREDIETTAPFRSKDLDLVHMALVGKPGIMRLAWQEAALDVVLNSLRACRRMVSHPSNVFFTRELLRTLPARQLVTELNTNFFKDIVSAFNGTSNGSNVGIAFNSYDPVNGQENVYLNGRAAEILGKTFDDPSKIRGPRTVYKPINEESVRDALWIVQYGFDDNKVIDGAYHRQIMLDELMAATDIYVARPIKYCWTDPLPTSWPDLEDMKTEMAFDGSYRCERDKVEIINKLLDDKAFSEEKRDKYHPVNLYEIELQKPRSFFDYVFEDERVFTSAREQAKKVFADPAQYEVRTLQKKMIDRLQDRKHIITKNVTMKMPEKSRPGKFRSYVS